MDQLIGEEPPKPFDLSLTNEEMVKYLINSFLETKSNLKIENINFRKNDIQKLL